jgi:hypothetical protein
MFSIFSRKKHELTLAIIAALLLLTVLGIVGGGMRFLARSLYSAFSAGAQGGAVHVQFDLSGARELGL